VYLPYLVVWSRDFQAVKPFYFDNDLYHDGSPGRGNDGCAHIKKKKRGKKADCQTSKMRGRAGDIFEQRESHPTHRCPTQAAFDGVQLELKGEVRRQNKPDGNGHYDKPRLSRLLALAVRFPS
jgi:hypothetical protein